MILMNWNLPEKENPEHPGSGHCGELSDDLFWYKMGECLTSFVFFNRDWKCKNVFIYSTCHQQTVINKPSHATNLATLVSKLCIGQSLNKKIVFYTMHAILSLVHYIVFSPAWLSVVPCDPSCVAKGLLRLWLNISMAGEAERTVIIKSTP